MKTFNHMGPQVKMYSSLPGAGLALAAGLAAAALAVAFLFTAF